MAHTTHLHIMSGAYTALDCRMVHSRHTQSGHDLECISYCQNSTARERVQPGAAARILLRAGAAALSAKSGRDKPTRSLLRRALGMAEMHFTKSSTESTAVTGGLQQLPMALRIMRSRSPNERQSTPRCIPLQNHPAALLGDGNARWSWTVGSPTSERPLHVDRVPCVLAPVDVPAMLSPRRVIQSNCLMGIRCCLLPIWRSKPQRVN
jgi:hypothetical protein